MTLHEKYLQIKSATGLTAGVIANRLNSTQKVPKSARIYTKRIIYNVLNQLSTDENIEIYINNRYSQIYKN